MAKETVKEDLWRAEKGTDEAVKSERRGGARRMGNGNDKEFKFCSILANAQ